METSLLNMCEKVMNDTRYEGCKIAENETSEIHFISARKIKRICQVKKDNLNSVYVVEFSTAQEFASLMSQFNQIGTIKGLKRSALQG